MQNSLARTPEEVALLAQWEAFSAALPELIAVHAGRWVVWYDGLRSVHDDEDAAERWALTNLGRAATFVLAPAEVPRTLRMGGLYAAQV